MAVTHAGLESDLRMASKIEGGVALLLADRFSLMQASMSPNGYISYFGDVAGSRSDTHTVPLAGLDGYDAFASIAAEETEIGETALTDSSANIAVAPIGLRRDITDLADLTAGPDDVDAERLALSLIGEAEMGWMQLVADAIDGFTNVVGAAGVDMSVDDHFDAIYQLEISECAGPFFGMLAPRQIADLQESVRSESGAIQYRADAQGMLGINVPGVVAEFGGVLIARSGKVNTSAGDRYGAYWSVGALGWKTGTPRVRSQLQRVVAPGLLIELERNGAARKTRVIGTLYAGVSVLQQNLGVCIRTDA